MDKNAYSVTAYHRGMLEEITVLAQEFKLTNGMLEFFNDGQVVESFTPSQWSGFSYMQVDDGQAA